MQTNNTVSENHSTCSSIFQRIPRWLMAAPYTVFGQTSCTRTDEAKTIDWTLKSFLRPLHIQYFSRATTDINPFGCGRFRRQELPFCREIHQCVPNRLLEYLRTGEPKGLSTYGCRISLRGKKEWFTSTASVLFLIIVDFIYIWLFVLFKILI
jgi:hypothetical protein